MADYQITDNSDNLLKQTSEAVERALEMIGLTAEAYASLLVNVDTGRLRGSITHATAKGHSKPHPMKNGKLPPAQDYEMHGEVEKDTVVVGTNVEYAIHQELNHKAYLRPAFENHKDEYQKILASELSKIKI